MVFEIIDNRWLMVTSNRFRNCRFRYYLNKKPRTNRISPYSYRTEEKGNSAVYFTDNGGERSVEFLWNKVWVKNEIKPRFFFLHLKRQSTTKQVHGFVCCPFINYIPKIHQFLLTCLTLSLHIFSLLFLTRVLDKSENIWNRPEFRCFFVSTLEQSTVNLLKNL